MKRFFNCLAVVLVSVFLLTVTTAGAQTVPAIAPVATDTLAVQPLPPGKYSVDVVQTVARNGHLTINNSLNIVGTAENGWKGSTYKFFGNNSNICTTTPAIVTQKISENKLRMV